ncbi:MAG: response regulator [Synergistaceae bacterium]|jgi:PAS domain S-box-containing protein|nr:response regulator [Synergistaceae bacterium]
MDAARTAELLKKEKYMKLLLESSPEIILILNQDGRIAYCTETLLTDAGIENFDMISGRPFQDLYALFGDEDFVRQGVERFEEVKAGRRTIANNILINFSRGGTSRMYTVQSSPMFDEDGGLDGVLVMYFDTTEVRNAEADESARLMLDATPLACSLWDEEGNMLDCNNEALRMFGLSSKSDYLKHIPDLSPEFQPDGMNSAEKAKIAEREAMETGFNQFEWMHLTMSGEELPVETTLVRIPWNEGYRLATYTRDLRSFKANERKAREANDRSRELEVRTRAAQVASDAKSRFLASMSHEIRTPMNAIIGMSDLMRTDNLDETQKGYFEDIRKMSKALLQIINDILDFSKIEAGRMALNQTNFNLIELCDNICSMSRFIAATKDLEFRHSIGPGVPEVIYGDDVRIRQVIVNILNNAIKYTREGYVDFQVALDDKDRTNGKECLKFVVSDSGIGIKPENMPVLFDAFRQFDGEANRGIMGTGLGLSITKNLVDMMKGEIRVDSVYGAGATFTILLPLVKGDPSMVEHTERLAFSIVTENARILVVDDNRINLKVALAYLAQHNVHADTALNGMDALEKIQNENYDLVFMDHMMPEMDGIETTHRIRGLGDRHADVPVIALSANAVSGAREAFIEAGMNDFISKPIDPLALNAMLLKWLPPDKVSTSSPQKTSANETSFSAIGLERSAFTVVDRASGLKNAAMDEELYRQLLTNFMSDHAADSGRVAEAIASGDAYLAHRLAHTLKSAAALIGAARLRDAAFDVEKKLADGGDNVSEKQLASLGEELLSVTRELKDFAEKPSRERAADPLDRGRALDLTARLLPLLKSGNSGSLDMIDEVRETLSPLGERNEILLKQMDNFDFRDAYETLSSIKASLAS